MADDVLSNYQHTVEQFTFVGGSKGVFDFRVNGELLYSKHQTGRHAEEGEILQIFRDYVGSDVPIYGT